MTRKTIVLSVLLLSLGVGLLAQADLPLLSGVPWGRVMETPPRLVRTVVATDSPAIDATSATWTGAQTHCRQFPLGCGSLVSISVLALDAAADPADGAITWKLWLVNRYGPMTLAAYGTWAMGALEVSHNPANGIQIGTDTTLDDADPTHYAWGELPVVTAEYWIYPVIPSGTASDVGRLTFKRGNAVGWYLEITDLAAASTIDALYIFIEEPRTP